MIVALNWSNTFQLLSPLFMLHPYLVKIVKGRCEPLMSMWLALNGSLILRVFCLFALANPCNKLNSQC